jgi:hypothetical protein
LAAVLGIFALAAVLGIFALAAVLGIFALAVTVFCAGDARKLLYDVQIATQQ